MNGNDLRTSNLVKYNVPGSSSQNHEVGYQIVLEMTDTDSEDDSNESVFSIQAETTVSAKDSSDISTNGEESDIYCSEFELASSSDEWPHPWKFDRNNSSESSPHQPDVDTAMKLWTADVDESGSNGGAEGCVESECDSDSDRSVIKCRFDNCVMCSSVNMNPMFQFCHSCYQIKKTFFPEKPPAKKKRKQNTECGEGGGGGSVGGFRPAKKRKLEAANEEKVKFGSSPDTGSGVGGGDSGFESLNSQNSMESPPSCSSSVDAAAEGVADAVAAASSSSSSSASTAAAVAASCSSKGYEVDELEENEEKCLACFRNVTNALFLHGRTGHRCCCYQCAKRIWLESGRCPICRSKVSNIIRILNV